MTRINTNVDSLAAMNSLSRSTSQLSTALTRLSTGLRINTGKDDPAGLIASEVLAGQRSQAADIADVSHGQAAVSGATQGAAASTGGGAVSSGDSTRKTIEALRAQILARGANGASSIANSRAEDVFRLLSG